MAKANAPLRNADAPLPAHANLAGADAGRNCVAARPESPSPEDATNLLQPVTRIRHSVPRHHSARISIFTNLLQIPFPFPMNNAKPTLTHKSIFDIASHANGRPSVERRRSHGVGLGCGAFLSLSIRGVGLVGRTAMIDYTFIAAHLASLATFSSGAAVVCAIWAVIGIAHARGLYPLMCRVRVVLCLLVFRIYRRGYMHKRLFRSAPSQS